jgi:hypothetical protein
MGQRHQIKFKTYDRFFPNQDTMPKGGFGNLIALPLQKAARDYQNQPWQTAVGPTIRVAYLKAIGPERS